MMTPRRRDLQALLRRELSRQARERGLGRTARVAWLVDQLENYVERWAGLRPTSSPAVPPQNDDLFLMVEVGAELVSEELRSWAAPAIMETWQGFLAALATVRGGCDNSERQLSEALAAVRSSLGP